MHRLILLRHAKAAWPDSVQDQFRPLASRGEDDAAVAAGLFAPATSTNSDTGGGGEIPRPDVVLCSPATRTRQTWRIAGAQLQPAPPVQYEPVIYGASVDEIIDLVRGLPEDTGTAVIVGHEPTLSRTTLALAGPSSSGVAVTRVQQKFPTCGIAVLVADGAWADLAPGAATLASFTVPRV